MIVAAQQCLLRKQVAAQHQEHYIWQQTRVLKPVFAERLMMFGIRLQLHQIAIMQSLMLV